MKLKSVAYPISFLLILNGCGFKPKASLESSSASKRGVVSTLSVSGNPLVHIPEKNTYTGFDNSSARTLVKQEPMPFGEEVILLDRAELTNRSTSTISGCRTGTTCTPNPITEERVSAGSAYAGISLRQKPTATTPVKILLCRPAGKLAYLHTVCGSAPAVLVGWAASAASSENPATLRLCSYQGNNLNRLNQCESPLADVGPLGFVPASDQSPRNQWMDPFILASGNPTENSGLNFDFSGVPYSYLTNAVQDTKLAQALQSATYVLSNSDKDSRTILSGMYTSNDVLLLDSNSQVIYRAYPLGPWKKNYYQLADLNDYENNGKPELILSNENSIHIISGSNGKKVFGLYESGGGNMYSPYLWNILFAIYPPVSSGYGSYTYSSSIGSFLQTQDFSLSAVQGFNRGLSHVSGALNGAAILAMAPNQGAGEFSTKASQNLPSRLVNVHWLSTTNSSLYQQGLLFNFVPYPGFKHGLSLAMADVDGDGSSEVITAPAAQGGPHVKVYSLKTKSVIREFFAYDSSFTGGVRLAAGDVTSDSKADIITAAGPGGGPHVKVFNGATGALISEFYADGNGNCHSGVEVSVIKATDNSKAYVHTIACGISKVFDPLTGINVANHSLNNFSLSILKSDIYGNVSEVGKYTRLRSLKH